MRLWGGLGVYDQFSRVRFVMDPIRLCTDRILFGLETFGKSLELRERLEPFFLVVEP